jgi:hypothetical protein
MWPERVVYSRWKKPSNFRQEIDMDLYSHVRVLFSIVLGLGVSRLLGGVARIVQHPK